MRITKHSETVTIEGTPDEIRELFKQAGYVMPAAVDPQTLTVSDSRRYQPTGRVSDYGQEEMIDIRTGRRGVYHNSMGMGFVRGAYITDSGNVEYEHPWDNPLQGCRF